MVKEIKRKPIRNIAPKLSEAPMMQGPTMQSPMLQAPAVQSPMTPNMSQSSPDMSQGMSHGGSVSDYIKDLIN
jgi:hypothetical protein